MRVLVNSDVCIVQWLNLQAVICQHPIMGTVPNLLMVNMHLCLLRNINPLFGFIRGRHGRVVAGVGYRNGVGRSGDRNTGV